MKKISALILKMLGWKISGNVNSDINKYVMIIAPHTSFWDFLIGRLAFNVLGIKVKFLIKKEFFVFPINLMLKALGGVPVNRGKSFNLVNQVSKMFSENKRLAVAITPEGTRKLNHNWKKGFYLIALKSKVPIVLGYLDYKEKTAGIGEMFYPSGDYEKDFKMLENFYKSRSAKYPENFNLSN